MTDERQGLPSASSFHMDVACPGRQNLLRSLLPHELAPEPDNPLKDRGVRIHDAQMRKDFSKLEDDERSDSLKIQVFEANNLELFRTQHGVESSGLTEKRETRVWLTDDKGNRLLSGQPDVVYIFNSCALVIDYKTGFNPHLTSSERNWQLRVLAVLVAEEYAVKQVRVGFIKPKNLSPSDFTDYSADDIQRATAQIHEVLRRSREPDAPRYAGNHCTYCPARNRCPEAAAYSMLPSVVANTSLAMSKKEVVAAVQKLTPSDWKFLHQRAPMIRNILDAAKDSLKALSPEELLAIGLRVGEGRRMLQVDAQGAYAVLQHFISARALWSCFEFNRGALVKAIQSEKVVSEAEARRIAEAKLEPFTDNSQRSAGSLEET